MDNRNSEEPLYENVRLLIVKGLWKYKIIKHAAVPI